MLCAIDFNSVDKNLRHTQNMDIHQTSESTHARPLHKFLVQIGLVLILAVWANHSLGQERFVPSPLDIVLPTSVHTRGGKQDSLHTLDQAWRAQPQDLDAALVYARAVFNLGLSEGDLRWFGSAKAALSPWWRASDLPAEAYFLRGLVKQGFHDFDEGLQDIDHAINLEPDRPELWSWRFALHLLFADMASARQDTEEIARRFGEEEANVYRAVLLYRTGQPLQAVQLLTQIVQSPSYQDAGSQDWLGFHLGEAHRVAGQPDMAITVWRERLKLSARSHLLRLSLAELLNKQGRYQQAKATAIFQTDLSNLSDALLMQALLASRGTKNADEARLADLMDARLKTQALRREALIERPKLVYQISYGKDLPSGLALSIENWRLQKEPPDALLFVQVALALGQPHAAEPVVVWMEQTGYLDPELNAAVKRLKSHPSWKGLRS
jgi:predicted Zn-dependent protease